MTDTKRGVYEALENAIALAKEYRADADEVVTDAVLLIATQHIDDDGDRCGRVFVFPRHGYQPIYITKGMLIDGLDMIRRVQNGDLE